MVANLTGSPGWASQAALTLCAPRSVMEPEPPGHVGLRCKGVVSIVTAEAPAEFLSSADGEAAQTEDEAQTHREAPGKGVTGEGLQGPF